MRKYIFAFALLLCSLSAMAQTQEQPDTVIITLRNGTEVRYTSDQFDRIQVIFNLHYGVKVYLKNGKSKDYLASQVTYAKYHQGGQGGEITDNNVNRNRYRAKLLEYPHLAADSTMNQLVIKSTSDYGITLSLEWSYADKANRWSCYQLHDGNLENNVDRTDDFKEDTAIPKQYRTTLKNYKNNKSSLNPNAKFSRGHLCPSADRLCSLDQNKQTFFLSNMQPQYQPHNGGLWSTLEENVRKCAEFDDIDTLYVVKAATIRADQLLPEKCVGEEGELIVPKYFYMALLAYNKNADENKKKYKAIGIWTLHKNETESYKSKGLSAYAKSIDDLEELTGIDFFCNLPDDIENEVESSYDLKYWNDHGFSVK